MSRISELLQRLLSKVALTEEQIDIQANGDRAEYSPDDGRKVGEESVRPFWESLVGSGEVSESARAEQRNDTEQQIVSGGYDLKTGDEDTQTMVDDTEIDDVMALAQDTDVFTARPQTRNPSTLRQGADQQFTVAPADEANDRSGASSRLIDAKKSADPQTETELPVSDFVAAETAAGSLAADDLAADTIGEPDLDTVPDDFVGHEVGRRGNGRARGDGSTDNRDHGNNAATGNGQAKDNGQGQIADPAGGNRPGNGQNHGNNASTGNGQANGPGQGQTAGATGDDTLADTLNTGDDDSVTGQNEGNNASPGNGQGNGNGRGPTGDDTPADTPDTGDDGSGNGRNNGNNGNNASTGNGQANGNGQGQTADGTGDDTPDDTPDTGGDDSGNGQNESNNASPGNGQANGNGQGQTAGPTGDDTLADTPDTGGDGSGNGQNNGNDASTGNGQANGNGQGQTADGAGDDTLADTLETGGDGSGNGQNEGNDASTGSGQANGNGQGQTADPTGDNTPVDPADTGGTGSVNSQNNGNDASTGNGQGNGIGQGQTADGAGDDTLADTLETGGDGSGNGQNNGNDASTGNGQAKGNGQGQTAEPTYDDTRVGGAGKDSLKGGDGDDLLDGGAGNDKIDGGQGDDTLIGGEGRDSLKGGDGDDLLDGGAGNDKLDGNQGDDTLIGGEGKDKLKGGRGDDVLDGGSGKDKLDGGKGEDTARFDGNAANYVVSSGKGSFKIEDLREEGSVDTVKNVETFEFADQTFTADELTQAIADGWFETATAPEAGIAVNEVASGDILVDLELATIASDYENNDNFEVTISGVPERAQLSAGTENEDGSWSMTVMQMAALAIAIPAASSFVSEAFALTVQIGADGDVQQVMETIEVTVDVLGESGQVEHFRTLSAEAALNAAETGETASQPVASMDEIGPDSLDGSSNGNGRGAKTNKGQNSIGNGDSAAQLLEEAEAEELIIEAEEDAEESGGLYDLENIVQAEDSLENVDEPAVVVESSEDTDAALLGLTETLTETTVDTNAATENDSADNSPPTNNTVDAVADTPSLSVADASGDKNTAITLSFSSALTDTDGSESLSIVIAGVPTGATLSAGTDNGDGTWTLTSAQLSGLTITPPNNDADNFTLTVTATATEGASSAQSVGTVSITVFNAVADAPSLTANDVTGSEDTSISLSLSSALTDTEGAEVLGNIVISNVPVGTQFSAGTNNGDGTWTFTAAQLSGLTLTPPPDRETNITLNVAAMSTEGVDTATTNGSFTVTVNPVADTPDDITFSADAVDENAANGAVVGTATGVDADSGETFTYSLSDTANGRFAIDGNSGQITVADGSQLDFESAMTHNITIRVTDSTGRTYDETKAITLNDLSEYGDTFEAEVFANGPVAFWRLGENGSTTAVDEVNGANGAFVNTTTGGFTAPFGNITSTATDFDGVDDHVIIPNSSAWDLTDGSIQLWFNAGNVSTNQSLLSRDAGGGNEGDFKVELSNDTIKVRLQGVDGGTLTTSGVVAAGAWYQLTVTFGANGLEIYLDGTRVGFDATITGGIDGNSTDWTVGAKDGAASGFFDGQIAEFAIFDSQLTETSIDGLYSAGDSGTDLVTLTAGADVNAGTAGEDFVAGGDGDDTLSGAAGGDRLYGDGGDDTLNGGDGADILSGGNGADILNGDAGDDVLSGSDGDDTLQGGAGADILLGGAGNDTATYADSASAVLVNLNTGVASGGDAQGDSLTSIENLTGSAFGDTLVGDSDANIFTGNAGDDIFQGLGGADTLYGGDGSDIFTVGEGDGNDIIDGGAGGGWTDSITLQNADSSSVGSGWTLSLTSGSEQSDDGSTKTLSSDAAGTITLEDGTQIAFQNIESIDY